MRVFRGEDWAVTRGIDDIWSIHVNALLEKFLGKDICWFKVGCLCRTPAYPFPNLFVRQSQNLLFRLQRIFASQIINDHDSQWIVQKVQLL